MACTAWPKRKLLRRETQQTIATTGASEAAERTTLRSRRKYRRRPSVQLRTRQTPFIWAGISRGPTPRLGSTAPKPGELQ
jgi:hypothetical protein